MNDTFWYSKQNNGKQWTHPRTGHTKRVCSELPIGWAKMYDEAAQRWIFYNVDSQQKTFVDPRLAFAVEEPTGQMSRLRQRFDASSTALQVLHGKDLHNRLAVITGANCGIGYETARSLAFNGCRIILACRNERSAQEAIERIVKERPQTQKHLQFMHVDLSTMKSVLAFTKTLLETVKYLSINLIFF